MMTLEEARSVLRGYLAQAQRTDVFVQERVATGYFAASPAEQQRIRDAVQAYWDSRDPNEHFLAHEFLRTVECPPSFLEKAATDGSPSTDAILSDHRYQLSDEALRKVHSAFVVDPLTRLTLAPVAVLAEDKLGLADQALPLLLQATATVKDVEVLRRAFDAFVVPERHKEFLAALRTRSPSLLASLLAVIPPSYHSF